MDSTAMGQSHESRQERHDRHSSEVSLMISMAAEVLERQEPKMTSQAPQETSNGQAPSHQRVSAHEQTQLQDSLHAGMTPPSSFRDDPEPSQPRRPLKRRRPHDVTESDTQVALQELALAPQPGNAGLALSHQTTRPLLSQSKQTSGLSGGAEQELPPATQPRDTICELSYQATHPPVSQSKQAPGLAGGALQQPFQFPLGPTQGVLGEALQPAGQVFRDAEELGLAIRGQYKGSDGECLAVAAQMLPLTILYKAIAMVKWLDEQYSDWRTRDCGKCLRLSQGTRTSFRWPKDDGQSAACQTCTNLREICCRYEQKSKTFIVAALPRCVRLDVAVSEQGFWLREGSERKTDSQHWR